MTRWLGDKTEAELAALSEKNRAAQKDRQKYFPNDLDQFEREDETKPKKPSKMRNKRVQTPQGAFSSVREWRRYGELLLMVKAGDIRDLLRQVRFNLDVSRNGRTVHICDYVADFTYLDYTKYGDGQMRVEDVKPNFKTEASRKRYQATLPYRMFLLKKRLMLAIHGIGVVEV